MIIYRYEFYFKVIEYKKKKEHLSGCLDDQSSIIDLNEFALFLTIRLSIYDI